LSSRRVAPRLSPAFSPREIAGDLDAAGLRITVVCSRWNPAITEALLASCLETLSRRGARADDVAVVRVPGAFELASAASAALVRRPDAVVALGAIVRGETMHHDVLARAVASALAGLAASSGVPIGFGILTCDTVEQARERVDKGSEAADAAVEMARLRQALARTKSQRPTAKGKRVTRRLHNGARPARRSHGARPV
jgi:6,7-dimethyl-8-ribityllumazine synthase